MKKWILVLVSACILLSSCSLNETIDITITEHVKKYEAMSYGEYKLETKNKAEFYHGNLFIGEIPESSFCMIYSGEYNENIAGALLADDVIPIRLQGTLDVLINGIEKEISLSEFTERLSAGNGKKAVYEILEGSGTAYYVGNKYALIQFDSNKDGKYDRQLSISMEQSENETISPESEAWLEII